MIFGGLECPVQEILKEFRALAPDAQLGRRTTRAHVPAPPIEYDY